MRHCKCLRPSQKSRPIFRTVLVILKGHFSTDRKIVTKTLVFSGHFKNLNAALNANTYGRLITPQNENNDIRNGICYDHSRSVLRGSGDPGHKT